MEKGKISSISGFNGGGTIAYGEGRTINYDGGTIVGKDRGSLKAGDLIWFERIGSLANAKAINIRRC